MKIIIVAIVMAVTGAQVSPGADAVPSIDQRISVPSAADQQRAGKVVDDLFRDDVAKARTADEKNALARRLRQVAADTRDDAASQYVLLARARDLAVAGADLNLSLAIIDELVLAYTIDADAARLAALTSAAKAPGVTILAQQNIVDRALALANDAGRGDRYEAAKQFADAAVAAARRANLVQALATANSLRGELSDAERAFADEQRAAAVLRQDANDPDANLAVGKFLCFTRADWEKGLAHLLKGKDADLKALAEAERARPADAAAELALADQWWEYSSKLSGAAKRSVQVRAGHWYAKASPRLTGLAKAKAEKRANESGFLASGESATTATGESGTRPTDARSAPAVPIVASKPMELLPLFDPAKHILKGKWKFEAGALIGGNEDHACVTFPVTVDGNYRMTVEFTRLKGSSDITAVLPVGEARVAFILSAVNGDMSGLLKFQGKDIRNHDAVVKPGKLENGRQYVMTIDVRTRGQDASIQVDLDGKPYFRWSGHQADLSLSLYQMPKTAAPGIGGYHSEIRFTRVSLQKLKDE